MKVTAITKFKLAILYQAVAKIGWTQSELARQSGLGAPEVGEIINMKRRPNEREAQAIQMALGKGGVYIDILEVWPESFRGFKQRVVLEQTQDVPVDRLIDYADQHALNEYNFDKDSLEAAMQVLDQRERAVVERYYLEGKTTQDTGKSLGVSRERVHQLLKRALRKMRHFLAPTNQYQVWQEEPIQMTPSALKLLNCSPRNHIVVNANTCVVYGRIGSMTVFEVASKPPESFWARTGTRFVP
jgi:RNA polymerase sigma factor (sigma-70 family)